MNSSRSSSPDLQTPPINGADYEEDRSVSFYPPIDDLTRSYQGLSP
ncbi:hypothetical protein AYI68_g6955, partial [Smittium mucronatum]